MAHVGRRGTENPDLDSSTLSHPAKEKQHETNIQGAETARAPIAERYCPRPISAWSLFNSGWAYYSGIV